MPDYKQKQFYKDDYGSMMNSYEKYLQHNKEMPNQKPERKKATVPQWTKADQFFEEQLWVS